MNMSRCILYTCYLNQQFGVSMLCNPDKGFLSKKLEWMGPGGVNGAWGIKKLQILCQRSSCALSLSLLDLKEFYCSEVYDPDNMS